MRGPLCKPVLCRPVLITILAGCAGPAAPPSCAPMCAAAAELYGACLDAQALDWTAAGYQSQTDFVAACDTWAWEQAHVLDDALGQELTTDALWLDRTCQQREAAFSDPQATCQTYTSVDWDAVPWG